MVDPSVRRLRRPIAGRLGREGGKTLLSACKYGVRILRRGVDQPTVGTKKDLRLSGMKTRKG